MKQTINFVLLICSIALLSACGNDTIETQFGKKEQANFRATIGDNNQTRTTGDNWDANDAIGVYALKSGSEMSDGIFNRKANIKYITTEGDGEFSAGAENEAIEFDNTILDFIAYYPYEEGITDKYNIYVRDQSNPGAIDLLYSNNAIKKSINSPDVYLEFNHMLSMIVFKLEYSDELTSLNDTTATINGLKTKGTFDLNNKSIVLNEESEPIVANITYDKDEQLNSISAMLIPTQNMNNATVEFKIDGKTFEWKPKYRVLESGKKYTYNLELTSTGGLNLKSSTINKWDDVNIDDEEEIIVKPEGEEDKEEGNGDGEDTGDGEGNGDIDEKPDNKGNLLFKGADFENWDEFKKESLYDNIIERDFTNKEGFESNGSLHYKIETAASTRNKKIAIKVDNETIQSNDYISFYLKGSSTEGLYLSLEKYESASPGKNIVYYNIGGNITESIYIEPKVNKVYETPINTNGNWIKIYLNISELKSNDIDCFGLYVADDNGDYNLYFDDIMVE